MKALSQVVRGWQLGWLLRYQNGALIETPTSANQLENNCYGKVGSTETPANLDNRVPGANPLLVNPNCGCFNPQTHAGPQSGRLDRSRIGAVGHGGSVLQRLPLATAADGEDELRQEFPVGKEGRV